MDSLRRILYILPQPVYPADSGPKHHTFGLLRYIAQRCECHIIGFSRGADDLEAWRTLEAILPNTRVIQIVPRRTQIGVALARLRNFVCFKPVSFCVYQSDKLSRAIPDIMDSFHYDLVHFDTFNVSEYRPACSQLPTVLIPYDAFSMGARRAMNIVRQPISKLSYWWKWQAYSRYERSAYRQFTKVCPVSEVDAAWLTTLDPAMDVETIGIPVPDEFFVHARQDYTSPNPLHILISGLLAHDAAAEGMIEFLKEVYPRIRSVLPKARVTVWGRNLVPALRQVLATVPDVEYQGYVPDYRQLLASATMYVYPQRYGSGIQTKVQQPMALGIPVVTRSHALDALGAVSGVHALACDDNWEMAQAVIALAQDVSLRARIGVAGSKHIRQSYGGDAVGSKLEAVYHRAIEKHTQMYARN